MINSSRKRIARGLLAAGLCTGMMSINTAWSYDGDIDYLAPYVTLDPESGTLVTIDPRKDQAAAAELKKQHDATAPDTAAGTTTPAPGAASSGTDSSVTAAPATVDMDQKSGPGTAVIAAAGGLFIIGVIVAMTRRKSNSPATDDKQGA